MVVVGPGDMGGDRVVLFARNHQERGAVVVLVVYPSGVMRVKLGESDPEEDAPAIQDLRSYKYCCRSAGKILEKA